MATFQTPKGMKDFSGAKARARLEMMEKIEKVYRNWGYQPLFTPALESEATLTAKSGNEIAGQLFRIEESELAMRFDLTVPLARFAANSTMAKPYKRYCIAPVWRREEPQKGRMREFLQADADIIGTPSMRAEAELLAMASEALRAIGVGDFEILLNSRKILSGLIAKLGIEKELPVFRALDKLDKIGEAGVRQEMAGAGLQDTQIRPLMEMAMAEKAQGGLSGPALEKAREYSAEGVKELEELTRLLADYGITNVRLDLSLVRGLDYYTGPIFEVKAGEGIGSVAGGGRYDHLLELYGQKDYAVGISLGIERLLALQEEKDKDAKKPAAFTQVCVISLKTELYSKALELATKLRKAGIAVETDLNDRPMRKQLDYANSAGIPFAAIIGEQEAASGQCTLKDLKTGQQKTMSVDEAIDDILEASEPEPARPAED